MARKLLCDRCGDDAPDTDETRQQWVGLLLHKVEVVAVPIKDYDLCKKCSNEVRRWLQTIPTGPKGGQ